MHKSLYELLPLGSSLAIIAKNYFGALANRLNHLEIERYYTVLMLIENTPSVCTQQFICDSLKIDKVSMVRIISYLIEKKLVKKILNPNDRREYFLELTTKAMNTMSEIHTAVEEINKAALKNVSTENKKELYKTISTIQKNLEELPSQKIYINYKKASKKHEA